MIYREIGYQASKHAFQIDFPHGSIVSAVVLTLGDFAICKTLGNNDDPNQSHRERQVCAMRVIFLLFGVHFVAKVSRSRTSALKASLVMLGILGTNRDDSFLP